MKQFKLLSLGCRLNVAELEEYKDQLIEKGLVEGRKPDLVIINSCSVTHKADKETRQLIRKVKKKHPKARLVVTGCFVGYDKLSKQASLMKDKVDLWVLNKDKDALVDLL